MASDEQQEPNRFVLSGYDGTEITYSTTSITGQAQLSYKGPKGEHNFSGGDIRVDDTELGSEVSVTLETVPDLGTTDLTVLIPPFRLEGNEPADFETVAIVTTKRTTIAGPPPGAGFSYETVGLKGEASFVVS